VGNNLGCIDLNQWYAAVTTSIAQITCISISIPFRMLRLKKSVKPALFLKLALDSLKITSYCETTGSKGIHIYIPIKHGPTQKQV
jgi:bifunctional non-homologous end joining protein LigD